MPPREPRYFTTKVCSVDLHDPTYTPQHFLLKVQEALGCKRQIDLAEKLGVHPQSLVKIRYRQYPLTAAWMVRIADLTGWSIAKIREMSGMPVTNNPLARPKRIPRE
jgi:hypothetical protein